MLHQGWLHSPLAGFAFCPVQLLPEKSLDQPCPRELSAMIEQHLSALFRGAASSQALGMASAEGLTVTFLDSTTLESSLGLGRLAYKTGTNK